LRLTLEPIPIADKRNAIPALKPLLEKVRPPQGTASRRARFSTQDLGGDYRFGWKGHQSGLLDQARRLTRVAGFDQTGRSTDGRNRRLRRQLEPAGAWGCRPRGNHSRSLAGDREQDA
jgi:hypothetical protein